MMDLIVGRSSYLEAYPELATLLDVNCISPLGDVIVAEQHLA